MRINKQVILFVGVSLLMAGCAGAKFDEVSFDEKVKQNEAENAAQKITLDSQLGDETTVGHLKIRPPKAFVAQPVTSKKAGDVTYTWIETVPGVGKRALSVKVCKASLNGKETESELKIIYKSLMLGIKLSIGLSDFRETEPQILDFNGMHFVWGKWSGLDSAKKLCYGFSYMAYASSNKEVFMTGMSPDIAGYMIADRAARSLHQ